MCVCVCVCVCVGGGGCWGYICTGHPPPSKVEWMYTPIPLGFTHAVDVTSVMIKSIDPMLGAAAGLNVIIITRARSTDQSPSHRYDRDKTRRLTLLYIGTGIHSSFGAASTA